MKIKDRLNRYRDLNFEIKQLQNMIINLRETMYSIRSTSDMRELSGGTGEDKMAAFVSKIDRLENEYFDKINKILEEQKAIEEMIDELEPVERLLIRSRYIECNSWDKVSLVIGYSLAQVHRIHNEALKKIKHETP